MAVNPAMLFESKRVVLLDGAMGTELQRRGYRTVLPLWSAMANLEAPALVKEIHDDYIHAGADIITANTFRTTRHTFSKSGNPELTFHLSRLAVELACESAMQSDRQVLVAGSIAPLEDCYRPDLVPDTEVIRASYSEQVDILIDAGVDMILAETMINISEVHILSAILADKGFPWAMAFCVQNGCLLDGTSLDNIIPQVAEYNPLALLLNCRPADEITRNLAILTERWQGITGAYGNGPGHPDDIDGWTPAHGSIERYCAETMRWISGGARIIGGCCGTSPGHIEALNVLL